MHFGFVWDVSGIDGGPDTLRIYVNGSIAASSTETWPTEPAFDPYLYVGSMSNCDPWDTFYNAVKGVTDNLVIWNYAKTDFSDRFIEGPDPQFSRRTVPWPCPASVHYGHQTISSFRSRFRASPIPTVIPLPSPSTPSARTSRLAAATRRRTVR